MNKKQMVFADLTAFAAELKYNGFTVLVSAKHPFEWLHFEKDGQFGDVNPDGFLCYDFGTVHKPCRECGTGFGVSRNGGLTIELANEALIFAPNWATQSQRKAIKKYKDVDEFINSVHNKWAEYYIL